MLKSTNDPVSKNAPERVTFTLTKIQLYANCTLSSVQNPVMKLNRVYFLSVFKGASICRLDVIICDPTALKEARKDN